MTDAPAGTAPMRVYRSEATGFEWLNSPRRWRWQCRLCSDTRGAWQGNSALTQSQALDYAIRHYEVFHGPQHQERMMEP